TARRLPLGEPPGSGTSVPPLSLATRARRPRHYFAALWIAAALLASDLPGRAATTPRRDPPDQPFRRAPMAESSRSIVIPLATNLHLAFDAQLLRTHAVWAGAGLNLRGPPYTGEKSPFLCDFSGGVLWNNPPVFPWSAAGQPRKDLNAR